MSDEEFALPLRPSPWRWLRRALGAALLLSLLLLGRGIFRWATRPFDPTETPLGAALSQRVPIFLVALGRARDKRPEAHLLLDSMRAEVVPAAVASELGEPGAGRLREALAAAQRVPWAGPLDGPESRAFFEATGQLNKALEDRQKPFFLDADVMTIGGGAQPVIYSFYVEREARPRVDGEPHRALHVWRIDNLSLVQAALGYTRPESPAAMVLLDQIERELVLYVLPSLPPGEPMALVDEDDDEDWSRELNAGGARVVREAFAGGEDEPTVAEIGRLLARRRALVARWQRTVSGLGQRFRTPERLIPEADYATALASLVPHAELYEWEELHDKLTSKKLEAAFVRLRGRFASTIERHELQHHVDFARKLPPLPDDIQTTLGLVDAADAPPMAFAGRVRHETSAYLAAMAGAPRRAKLDLALLERHLFDPATQSGAYGLAALVVLSQVARELNIDPEGTLIDQRRIARGRACRLLLRVLERPPELVGEAAGRAWARLYGRPLPDVTPGEVIERTPWRH